MKAIEAAQRRLTSAPADGRPVALDVTGLTVSYEQKPVLRHASARIAQGLLVAIIGPNGAGKSTFLKAVLGLLPIDAGTIHILGEPAERARRRVAYVPQTDSADWDFPITVREVVLMGRYRALGLFGRPGRRDRELVAEAIETVGMTAFADRHIRQLSGGQQQRVFLARALAQQAELMLLDEPFAGVDARTEAAIFELMLGFSQRGKTLIVVNHNLQILDRFDAVLMINQSVVAYGPAPEVVTPENMARTYGGRMSFVDEAERMLREDLPHAD